MNRSFRSSGYGALLVLVMLLAGGVATSNAATTYQLGSSTEIPAAQGKARLQVTKNGNVEIRLTVKHLAPPGRIVPGAEVFVVWVRGLAPDAPAQNLGALIVDRNLSGKLKSVTSMASFDLFLTCEQSQTASAPGVPELLPLRYPGK